MYPMVTNRTGTDVPEGQKIQLFKNFRSRKQVLDFTNLIFENIMGEKLGEIEFDENEQNLLPEIDIIDTMPKISSTSDNNMSKISGTSDNNDRY